MKKFIVTYHAPIDALQQTANASPEEMAKGMEPWMAWANKCGNQLLDMGTPLIGGQAIDTKGNIKNSDRAVCGFSVLQANNMDEATKLVKDHPHLAWTEGCEVEVHECMPLPF